MKAISLWQPWASLVAIQAKTIETRHWPAPKWMIGERIAIHAAKRWTDDERSICCTEPFATVLEQHTGVMAEAIATWKDYLPLGALVATADLYACVPSEIVTAAPDPTRSDAGWIKSGGKVQAYPYEFAFGNLNAGRWAWLLLNIQALPEPIPFKGAQGFFEVPL